MNDIKWSHMAWQILTAQMHPPNISHWLRKNNAYFAQYAKQKHVNPFWQFTCLTADCVCWQSPTVHFRLQPEAQRKFPRHVKTIQQTLNILPHIMKQIYFLTTIFHANSTKITLQSLPKIGKTFGAQILLEHIHPETTWHTDATSGHS